MSYNYPMFMHNRGPSQNSVFHSNCRPHTISARSNANHDSSFSRYTSDIEHHSKSNRISMYNYEIQPEMSKQNKSNVRMESKLQTDLSYLLADAEKFTNELRTSKIFANSQKGTNDEKLDSKKTKVPISIIEFNRNSVCLKKKEPKNKSNSDSLSSESLIKTYSKKPYDNHVFEYNQYHLNPAFIYNRNGENFEEVATKVSSLFEKNNADIKRNDFSYNKFMYYNRLEEQYSSDNSEEKANKLENLKNFFHKSSSIYYDSGICGSNSTYVKDLKKHYPVKVEDKTFTENVISNDGCNESSKNSPKEVSSSSLSSDLSSSSNYSSTFSSSSKKRDRMNAMFKSMNLKSSAQLNHNSLRISLREHIKKIDLPINNLNDSKKSDKNNTTQIKSKTETRRADFTPHLFNKLNILKNGKPIVRNTKAPPLPQINYNNNDSIGRNSQNVFISNIDHNSFDSIKKSSLGRKNKNSINFLSNLNLNGEFFSNQKHSVINRNSTSSWNKMTSNSKNNMVKITDQFNVAEKFKLINCEKKCFALRDFVGLYSENINLIKGESYSLISRGENEWCYIRDKNGNIGSVPESYLEIRNEATESNDRNKSSHLEKNWFHGNITRGEAYTLLVGNQNFGGTYLVRYNSTDKDKFTLCVYKNGKVYNYKISCEDKQYFIDSKHKFKNLVELIEFYQKNQAGLISNLRYPAEKNSIDKKTLLENLQTVYHKFEIDRKDIEFHEKIGSGQFGVVLKAEFKKKKIVAVKKMKPGSKEDEMNFNREADFMIKLQNLQLTQHQNLMQLYGLSKDYDDSILIITEFVRFGSLYNYLLKNKERIINSKNRFTRLINICIDVCDGMEYLESNNIIHRDLATRNCLVGEGEVIKVADYGLARFTDDCFIAHPQSQFPVKWSAPEVIKYRSYSSKSDVWSFSCFMYEVFTLGKMPYGGSTANSVAAKQIISGIIPEKPAYCPNNLYENIITRAWSKNPKDRPSFKELLKQLENFT